MLAEEPSTSSPTKKDSVLERINKRNKDRQNYLDVKLEQRSKEQAHLEGADYFAQTFAERVREIESRIANISEQQAKRNNDGGGQQPAELIRLFADITLDIQELERFLTSSTLFLTDYRIKACQNVLHDLSARCEETRQRLLPKKKFGFSGKKVAVTAKPSLNSLKTSDGLDGVKGDDKTATTFEWTLSSRRNEHIVLKGSEVNGKDVTISDLSNCLVELQGHPGSVQISKAVDCVFLCGPIARSLFAENCRACSLAVACQQLRFHSSTACRIYMHVTCRAIIEDCKEIVISDYCYDYPAIVEDFGKAGLDKTQNNYTDVADFNWLSPDVPSPNWRLLKDAETPDWCELREKYSKASQVENKDL